VGNAGEFDGEAFRDRLLFRFGCDQQPFVRAQPQRGAISGDRPAAGGFRKDYTIGSAGCLDCGLTATEDEFGSVRR
jgi:hypothetical protein